MSFIFRSQGGIYCSTSKVFAGGLGTENKIFKQFLKAIKNVYHKATRVVKLDRQLTYEFKIVKGIK